MSLYRRGRIWWIELTSEAGRIRRSAGTADRKYAQQFHEKVKSEIWRQEKLGEAAPLTWVEAVAKWMAVKPRSMQDRYTIRALEIPAPTSLPISEALLTRRISAISQSGSPGSWNRYLALVIAIHNFAGISAAKVKRKPNPAGRTRWLRTEEWERLKPTLESESPLLRQAAEFTLATGLRENNVLELQWGQIDLRRRVAWLHGDQMKGGIPLGVPLNDAACAILSERRGVHKDWVFGNPDAPLTRASNRAWYSAVRKAKLPGFRWHDLRHTWASWHVMNGTRIEELQQLGGWKTLQMVQRYAHLAPDHLHAVAANVKPVSLSYNKRRGRLKPTTTPTAGA